MSDFELDTVITRENAAANFLKLFYPYHYTVGMAVETQLCGDDLDRHQAVILWLIHSRGEDGKVLRRKTIERSIGVWYEVGSSYISKTLRKMAAAPLELIEIREHPESAREKNVILTAKGEATVDAMKERAIRFIDTIVEHLHDDDIPVGMHFMSEVSSVAEKTLPPV